MLVQPMTTKNDYDIVLLGDEIFQLIGQPRHASKVYSAVYIFGIGHSCYGQLMPVKSRYLLTSITCPYHRLRFRAHQGHMFSFFKLTADQ